jgi:phosphoglycerate dehydrogenase-like enzyme
MSGPLTIVIASPLEEELVERMRSTVPSNVEVVFEPTLLPVPRYPGDHLGIAPDLGDEELARWRGILARADILLDFDWLDPAGLPQTAPRLRWVQATSSGIGEFIARTDLSESTIEFTTAAGVHAVALAEFVTLGLLYFCKRVPELAAWQRDHHWERFTTRRLAGSRTLLVGLGKVGSQIARQLDDLGVEVIGMARTEQPRPAGIARLITRSDLIEVLQGVDAIVLACPYTPETHHLIGAPELAALPGGAVLVNVARGRVVDEPALVEAIRSGHLGGAWLDVFAEEPLPASSPLWDFPNVLVSPHSASTVDGENGLIVELFLDNLRRRLDGRPMRNLFRPQRGY